MSEAALSTGGVQSGDILAEKYRVDRVLGQGGMGVVVLAEHIELRERVAIKFLLDEAAGNPELSERFIREARAAVRIKSEHVVRVIDVGRLPSGAPYMVMEYLDGQDLAERLLVGRLPIEDAVDYIMQCCEAMHVAHRAGIVHRDLKPANLFLTHRPDGSPLIKILDFGISKVKTPEAAQLSLTHTQAMMGSPLYMSPEQMRSSKDVSASADLWSLGVILHELISGDVPFTGETFPEVLVKVMGDPPPSLRSLRPEVPEELDAVVRRCLEKRPADRYSSVAALGVALTPFASQRTFGLQSRLASSVTDPPAVAVGRAVGATQIGGGVPAPIPIIVPARATAPFRPGAAAEALPSKTNTAWDAQTPAAAGAGSSRARRRTLALAGGGLFVVAIVAAGLLGDRREAPPAASLPGASAAAPPLGAAAAMPAPAVPAPPSPVASGPRIAPLAAPAEAALTGADVAPSEPVATPAVAVGEGSATIVASPPPLPSDGAALKPTSASAAGASARVGASAQHTAKAPRVRAGANARVSAASAAAAGTPAPTPAAKPRSKPLSIEFK